jgi:hypothetical protein
MKTAIIGTVAGLLLGTLGALAYSHMAADQALSDLQAQLDAANAKLAKTSQDRQQMASETSSVADQIDQLQASNDDLKKQLAEAKSSTTVATVEAPAQEVNPMTLTDIMRGAMRGGFQNPNQRMFLLQSRLHLSPDQANTIKAAMQADARTRGEMMRQMFGRGGRGGGGQGGGPGGPGGPGGGAPTGTVDPALAAKANTLDQTLATVLTPQQRAAYQQVQTEEQAARADTQATAQMNQLAPLLQLTDAQKDQMVQQLYQIQMQAPDPGTMMTNPNAAAMLTQQAQATQSVYSKVLNAQQLDLYQQEGQAVTQNRQGRNGNTAAGANGTNPAAATGGAGATASATPAAAGGTNAASSTASTDSTNSASATASSATNSASATTDSSTPAATTNTASSGDSSSSSSSSTTNATTQAAAPQ